MRKEALSHHLKSRIEGEHQPLAALARRQHGVVSIRQLHALGYSSAAVSRARSSGRLHRLHRGVYAVGHERLSLQGHCLAATLACGPGALLSHRSAAWLWEISSRGPAPFEVTAPVPRAARPPIRLHYASSLTLEDRALEDRIPVTALPRTLLDLATAVPSERLRKALDRAEQRGRFDLGSIESLLERSVGHPGVGRLRRGLQIYRPPETLRSDFERRFLAAVVRAGLPRPSANFFVAGYELDVYWPAAAFAVELDVYETHGTRAAFENDRRRQEDLKLLGIEMIRITEPRFDHEPGEVLERIGRLLRLARRRPAGA